MQPLLAASLAQLLADRARETPDAVAVHLAGSTLSYSRLNEMVAGRAASLGAMNVAPGAVLALAANGSDLLLTMLAAHWSGHPFMPLDPATAELRWPQLCPSTPPLPCLLPAAPLPGTAAVALEPASGESAALIIATSGSEGAPKGVVLPHRALLAAAMASNARIPLSTADTWLDCLPLTHVGGLSIFWRSFLAGASVRLHEGFDTSAVWADLQAGRASHISLVPAMLAQLLELADGAPPPATLRCVLVGGAALSRPLWQQARDAGWPLHVSYGMSETAAQIALLLPTDDWHEGLVGHALPAVDLAIGDDGRIRMRGPQRMRGYLGGAMQDCDEWLTTGDLGRIDPDGTLTVLGRADDVLVSGGHNLHPAEIEARLANCPGVEDAAVTRSSDPVWGDIITALVVGGAGEDSVAAWCRASLPSPMRPRRIVCVAALPRNAMGKLERRRLPDLLAESCR